MSVVVLSGNIFASQCQTIVNTINCVGVMGAGIALEMRLRYPDLYGKYVHMCNEKKIDIGLLWLYKSADRWILNFPTKRHWKYPSKAEYLHAGLKKFVETYAGRGIESIAFPLLGADKGGINPAESLNIMLGYLEGLDIQVEIYRYDSLAKDDIFDKTKSWLLSQDIDTIRLATGIKKSYIEKILEGMQNPRITQLNQLASIDGIGITTLERLFLFAKSADFTDTNLVSNALSVVQRLNSAAQVQRQLI